MPSKNPFAFKAKQQNKKKSSGKRVGKSKPEKANNQLNRRVKLVKGVYFNAPPCILNFKRVGKFAFTSVTHS